jgi:3-dehydroquinate dehydratase-2
MKLLIINGPNLNLLGKREGEIYGDTSFEDYLDQLRDHHQQISIEYFQSNIEGEIINRLHAAQGHVDGVIINPGGYTHTSVAIADAIWAISTPVVEVHITNLFAREAYRHVSLTGAACKGCITGFGLEGYRIAIQSFMASAEMRGV